MTSVFNRKIADTGGSLMPVNSLQIQFKPFASEFIQLGLCCETGYCPKHHIVLSTIWRGRNYSVVL